MPTKPFNAEEIAILSNSLHIVSIISDRIVFTPEFKREAYKQLISGKSMTAIFKEHGIDPDILGCSRIWTFTYRLRQNADRETGYEDLRSQNRRRAATKTTEQLLAAKVDYLEHELAYTRQEVEF